MENDTRVEPEVMLSHVYAVCPAKGADGFPEAAFFRLTCGSTADQVSDSTAMDIERALYFRVENGSCFRITQQEAQTYRLGEHNEVRMTWMHERQHANVPEVLVDQIEDVFQTNGFKEWKTELNAFGLVDEAVLAESRSSDVPQSSTIDNHVIFLSDEAILTLDVGGAAPSLLIIEAATIHPVSAKNSLAN